MDVDGLQGAERALDLGEAFVGADGSRVAERSLRQAGAHDIDAVERRLGGDRRLGEFFIEPAGVGVLVVVVAIDANSGCRG